MWESVKIEESTRTKLISDLGKDKGSQLFAIYTVTRSNLVEDILPEIRAIQPTLTDHGPNHINNVLCNAEKLLGFDVDKLSGIELYCLIMAIIFHDAGNVFNRDDHQNKIAQIYEYARPAPRNLQEKNLILRAVSAHCGEGAEGSKDTLKDLDEDTNLHGNHVSLRKIAAILRFADELAEGPQRTSKFIEMIGGYPDRSKVYHQYADITDISIDRRLSRIALTYHISLDDNGNQIKENELLNLLSFVYKRIIKLNEERLYARYYCDLLSIFQRISVAFNFWVKNEPVDLGLTKIEITDLILPGDSNKQLHEYDPCYKIEDVMSKIRVLLAVGNSHVAISKPKISFWHIIKRLSK